MKRIYTNNGQGISTKITCTVNGKKYIVSTAKDPRGFWQLAVFRVLFEIPYIYTKVDLTKSNIETNVYPGPISKKFEEAEKIHHRAEELVANYSPETWSFAMANWSLGEEVERVKKNYTTTDYIKDLEQSALEQKATIQKVWSEFQDKPNNEDTLRKKAKVLARIILQTIRLQTEMFLELGNVSENSDGKHYNGKSEFVSLGELFIEIASVYLLVVDKFAFSVLNKKSREIFTDSFQEEFVTRALLENYKENADLMENAFISDLNKRLKIYDPLPFYGEENKSLKGTVLWEFANSVAKIVGKEKQVFFIELIRYRILRDIDILQLEKLLLKEK